MSYLKILIFLNSFFNFYVTKNKKSLFKFVPHINNLATVEGLTVHAMSAKIRYIKRNQLSEDTFYIEEAEVDENNIITWNHELEQERKSSVFDLKKNCYFKLIKNTTGPYKIKIKFKEWKLYLLILDIKDNKEYENKYLIVQAKG